MVDKAQDNEQSDLSKHFPKPPDWEKVQNNVFKLTKVLDEDHLTYTEKFQILDLVTKMYEREFFNNSVIMFLDSMHQHVEAKEAEDTSHIYS